MDQTICEEYEGAVYFWNNDNYKYIFIFTVLHIEFLLLAFYKNICLCVYQHLSAVIHPVGVLLSNTQNPLHANKKVWLWFMHVQLNCDLTFSQRSKNKLATVSRPWVNTITESFSETHCPCGSVSTENHRNFKHWCYSLLDGKQINWFSENKLKYPNIFLVFPERKWQCLSD